jgi:hypothetical protein
MSSWVLHIMRRAWAVGCGWTTVQPAGNQHLSHLLTDLRRTQEALSAKQQELLEAITSDDAGANILRQEVRGLSELVMEILAQVERALQHETSSPPGGDGRQSRSLGAASGTPSIKDLAPDRSSGSLTGPVGPAPRPGSNGPGRQHGTSPWKSRTCVAIPPRS